MQKPERRSIRLIKENAVKVCNLCGSSKIRKGCINPECQDYYKRR